MSKVAPWHGLGRLPYAGRVAESFGSGRVVSVTLRVWRSVAFDPREMLTESRARCLRGSLPLATSKGASATNTRGVRTSPLSGRPRVVYSGKSVSALVSLFGSASHGCSTRFFHFLLFGYRLPKRLIPPTLILMCSSELCSNSVTDRREQSSAQHCRSEPASLCAFGEHPNLSPH